MQLVERIGVQALGLPPELDRCTTSAARFHGMGERHIDVLPDGSICYGLRIPDSRRAVREVRALCEAIGRETTSM